MLRTKKTVVLVVVGLLVLAMVSAASFAAWFGWGGGSKDVTLKVCLPSSSWGGSADPGLMDEVKKYMEQQNGVKIEMIAPPMNTYSDKINVLLASGDVPDVFRITKAMRNIHAFTQRGYTADLNKYVKNNKILSKVDKKYFDYLTLNGVIRGIPMAEEQVKFLWTRNDLLKQYGVKFSSSAPSTEEFYNEMKKVKDRIPLTYPKFLDNLPFFYHSFGVYDEFIKDNKGKYYDVFNTQDMKDCLTYLNKLYNEGILDKEFPTNDNTVLRNNLISGKATVNIDYDTRYAYYMSEIIRLDPNAKPELKPLFCLKGPKGHGGTLNEAIQDCIAVSPKSKNPQKAVDLVAWAYFTVDGQKVMQVGLPGKHYVVENGEGKLTPQAEAGGQSLDLNNILKRMVPFEEIKDSFGFKFPGEEIVKSYYDLVKDQSKYVGRKEVIAMGQSTTYDRYGASLNKKRQEIALQVIIGNKTVDAAFKEYNDFFKSINGDQIIKELNSK